MELSWNQAQQRGFTQHIGCSPEDRVGTILWDEIFKDLDLLFSLESSWNHTPKHSRHSVSTGKFTSWGHTGGRDFARSWIYLRIHPTGFTGNLPYHQGDWGAKASKRSEMLPEAILLPRHLLPVGNGGWKLREVGTSAVESLAQLLLILF